MHYLLGLTFMSRGSSAEALDPLRKAAELEPENPDYQQSLGLCLEDLEKDRRSHGVFQSCPGSGCQRTAAYLQIGILQMKVDATAEAEQSFKTALSIDASYAPAYFRLGKIYYDRNDDAQALKFLEKARELGSGLGRHLFSLGHAV